MTTRTHLQKQVNVARGRIARDLRMLRKAVKGSTAAMMYADCIARERAFIRAVCNPLNGIPLKGKK